MDAVTEQHKDMDRREREHTAALAKQGGDMRVSDDSDSDSDGDDHRASGLSSVPVKTENVVARSGGANTAQDGWRSGASSKMPMVCNVECP